MELAALLVKRMIEGASPTISSFSSNITISQDDFLSFYNNMIPWSIHKLIPIKKSLKTKCYSARTGLRHECDKIHEVRRLALQYKGCLHCGWYSHVFYSKTYGSRKIIQNDADFEKVKEQFVNHMNRSHPDICKKKLMMQLDNKQQLV